VIVHFRRLGIPSQIRTAFRLLPGFFLESPDALHKCETAFALCFIAETVLDFAFFIVPSWQLTFLGVSFFSAKPKSY
jgi:hypothetical protein